VPTDLDPVWLRDRVVGAWEADVLPALAAYTRLECLSPAFDPDWEAHGQIHAAARQLADWCATRAVPGASVRIEAPPGRTPVLVVESPGTGADPATVLVYGHLDKQPPLGEWREGLGPFEPVREGDLLYGRGTADDGYSVFAALIAVEALVAAGGPRPRVVTLIEASEESGSPDLDAHLDALAEWIGRPSLVVCLDSGALTYDRLWLTTSLRGLVVATLRVDVLTHGVHSGLGGGVVPDSFRLARQLLSRIEDEHTGEITLPALTADPPEEARRQLVDAAAELPDAVDLPVVEGLLVPGPVERLVRRAWGPALAVTGAGGLPAIRDAGNVLRASTVLQLAVRLPPTVDAVAASQAVAGALLADPPEGARVAVELATPAQGWVAPESPAWLDAAVDEATRSWFGRPPGAYGEGGSIPFLADLARRFPGVPMVATGVLGPGSNAHGPDESLHLPMAQGVTAALCHLLEAAARAHPQ